MLLLSISAHAQRRSILFTAKEMEQCKVDGIMEDAQETLDHYIYGHKF